MVEKIYVQNKQNGRRLYVEPQIYEAYKEYVDIVVEEVPLTVEDIEPEIKVIEDKITDTKVKSKRKVKVKK